MKAFALDRYGKKRALRSAVMSDPVLRDYDLVLNSQDGKTLEKSFRVLKI